MSTHNVGLYEEISKIITELSSNICLFCSVLNVIVGECGSSAGGSLPPETGTST